MSESVPGTDNWRVNVTAPSKLDPANGTEIKTGLEHLADRTYYLARLHLYRHVSISHDDAGYVTNQTLTDGGWETLDGLAIALTETEEDDLVIIKTIVNYSTNANSCEVQHISNLTPLGIVARRRLQVGSNLSFIHTSWYIVPAPGGPVTFNTQIKIDTGTLQFEGPYLTVARQMRETTT